MALHDILLHIDSYPDATPTEAIDQAVRLTAKVGGTVTALAVHVDIPLHSNRIADYLIQLSSLAESEEARSLQACRSALEAFKSKAQAAGVFGGGLIERANIYDVGAHVASRARTRDFCIVPMAAQTDGQEEVAHSVIFGSGRPALVFRSGTAAVPDGDLGVVVVAWDGSRSAARAMADALPILQKARQTRVLTVVNEKPSAVADLGAEAARHLQTHGVIAVVDEIDAAGEPIGVALDAYLKRESAELLVMGAFGHSRLREFVLGGATAHMLHDPLVPVFLAH